MSSFFTNAVPRNIDVKRRKDILHDVLLYEGKRGVQPDIWLLQDNVYETYYVDRLVKEAKAAIGPLFGRPVNINVLCVIPFRAREDKDLKNTIKKFYKKNTIDLSQYIRPGAKIVANQRVLYGLMQSDDVNYQGFYDVVFNKSYFYSPDIKSYVFPVRFEGIWMNHGKIPKDSWDHYFFQYQCKQAATLAEPLRRIPKPAIVEPENPNEFLQEWKEYEGDVAWDIETNTLDAFDPEGKIICFTCSFDGKTGYYLPWDKIDKSLLSEFLKPKKQILQNGKFDAKFVIKHGVERNSIYIYHDTMHASHQLNELQRNGLKTSAWLFTPYGGYDRDLDDYLDKHPEFKRDYSKIPKEVLKPYATMDAIVTYLVYKYQVNHFKKVTAIAAKHTNKTQANYFYNETMPAVNAFIDIELEGFCVDKPTLDHNSLSMVKEIKIALENVEKAFGVPPNSINFNSDSELGILLELKGYPFIERGKKGANVNTVERIKTLLKIKEDVKVGNIYLTGEDQLLAWKRRGWEKGIDELLKYRELKTLFKTFIGEDEENKNSSTDFDFFDHAPSKGFASKSKSEKKGYYKYLKNDGRVHSKFGVNLTDSHRNKCREPNLQNIPKHGEKAIKVRKMFKPPSPEFSIDELDGAGFQLRIATIYSQDLNMYRAFTEFGGDLHSVTAQSVLRRDLTLEEFLRLKKEGDSEIKNDRFKAKMINFSLLFNATAFSFAKSSIEKEWSLKECQDYIEKNNLEKKVDMLQRMLSEEHKSEPLEFAYYWAVASDIKRKHFETYPGLKSNIEKEIKFAEDNGYVISAFGAIRRLPQLLYKGKHGEQADIKNLKNIAANSPVQNYEVIIINRTLVALVNEIRKKNLKSRVVGTVHDSIVMYTHKDEHYLRKLAKQVFEENIPENNGVPLVLEVEEADWYGKGEVWGFGREITA